MTLIDFDSTVKLHRVQAGVGQFYLVATVASAGRTEVTAGAAYRMIAEQLALSEAEIVHERIFGTLAAAPIVLGLRERTLSATDAARVVPTFIEGAPLWGAGLAGIQIRAVQPVHTAHGITTLEDGSQAIGRGWSRGDLQQWLLQGITAGQHETQDTLESELHRLFARVAQLLNMHGASFADVTRTWFYIDDIVPGYALFNRIRNQHYNQHGRTGADISALQLPASTGIGVRNLANSRVIVDVLATRASDPGCIEPMTSSTQQAPVRYGSSFSRAAVVHEADCDLIQLSGTASIGAQGESLYPKDARAQIDSTVAHVSALLQTRGADLHDTASGTLFLKRGELAPLLAERLRGLGLDDLPLLAVVADVCRDELLFEMDAELVVGRT